MSPVSSVFYQRITYQQEVSSHCRLGRHLPFQAYDPRTRKANCDILIDSISLARLCRILQRCFAIDPVSMSVIE
jgi:hypothetical protein